VEFVPPDRLFINPDCGLRHVPADAARDKLRAMVAGTATVRKEINAGRFASR
jgi:5-methyltetrahydropteroyltriglutamate--homocysteine methyltransferase